jgi:hypothetical protein
MALTAKVSAPAAAAGTKRAPAVVRSAALQQRIRPVNSSSVSQVRSQAVPLHRRAAPAWRRAPPCGAACRRGAPLAGY